tara:strand:- start:2241 stop:2528 length:288 start_codon:yes stop_codon:yes gene_type:complete
MIQGIIALFKAMPFLAKLFEQAVDAYRIQKANARHDEKVRNIDDVINGLAGDRMSIGSIEQYREVDDGPEREGLQEGGDGQPRVVPGNFENDSGS